MNIGKNSIPNPFTKKKGKKGVGRGGYLLMITYHYYVSKDVSLVKYLFFQSYFI